MGKGSGGLSNQVTSGLQSNENALVALANQQNARSSQLFNATFPGLNTAEQFYGSLATGSPYAISTATAPAVAQIAAATQGTKKNILENAPAGGEKNLAIEQADVGQGGQVGQVATGAFLNAPNALASLAGQGVGESISSAGTALSGLSSASQTIGSLGQLQMEQYQNQMQAKGSTLGALSSLGGSIFEGAGAAGGLGALFAL